MKRWLKEDEGRIVANSNVHGQVHSLRHHCISPDAPYLSSDSVVSLSKIALSGDWALTMYCYHSGLDAIYAGSSRWR